MVTGPYIRDTGVHIHAWSTLVVGSFSNLAMQSLSSYAPLLPTLSTLTFLASTNLGDDDEIGLLIAEVTQLSD